MSKKLLRPDDAKDWFVRRYNNQHRAWLEGAGEWPLSVSLGVPTERDVTDDLREVRSWVESWTTWRGAGELAWEERKWPRIGVQRLPAAVSLASPREVASWAGQELRWVRAATRFDLLQQLWPQFGERPGLAKHFDILADYSDADFGRLQAALAWFLANLKSGLYVRQLPIEGIDTKWLETRKGVVTDFLHLLCGRDERQDFHDACGLSRAPHRVRMRVLCPALRPHVGGLEDLEVPLSQLAQLSLRPTAVVIVENQETGVALPDMAGVVAFMRLGNAVSSLAAVRWLVGLPAVYWGDIDTHGLAILSRARRVFPGLKSVLMDEPTLLTHKSLWSQEPVQHGDGELAGLSPAERAVFDGLKVGAWGPKVRLEQERLPWGAAMTAVTSALASARANGSCRQSSEQSAAT